MADEGEGVTPRAPAAGSAAEPVDALLDVVTAMARELHPDRAERLRVTLASDFDRDLGFDSLARVELLSRLNETFGIEIDEQVLESAETPADLLAAVAVARPPAHRVRAHARPLPADVPQDRSGAPAQAATLVAALEWHVAAHPDRPHVYLYGESTGQAADAGPLVYTYRDLLGGARAIANGVRRLGLPHGSNIAIMLPTSRAYLECFFGILLAGCVPVPIYPPTRSSQLEEHLRRHGRILDNAQAVLLITVERARAVARLLKARVPSLASITTPQALALADAPLELPALHGSDVAFIQYTSGSTGDPKGVVLTHANLLANIRAMGTAIDANSDDVFVSWLPLYHDMGLIGAWLGSLYYGIPLVLMSPLAFLTSPGRWLRAIQAHRGTLSAAPNFGYELCLKRIAEQDLEGLDLSSLRATFNGAEPVSPNTVRAFAERFGAAGLRPAAMTPVYGLAESAVGLSFTPINRGAMIDRIDRDRFLREGHAEPAPVDDADALEFVGAGRPLPGYRLRIVDAGGAELPAREQGRLQFQGPSATSGYFRNPEATRQLFDGDWLDTGDLAYIADGDLYLTGRVKDTIIRAGRNLYPQELEEAVGALPGIRAGCVAVIGVASGSSGTERLIVVAETRETDPGRLEALVREINGRAGRILGGPPDDVVLVPPHSVLKTSSGKIRRSAVKALYGSGKLGRREAPTWLQLLRLGAADVGTRFRRWRIGLGRLAYAAYVHALFWTLAPLVWLLVLVAPRRRWRWSIARAGASALLALAGVRPRVEGLQHVAAADACVVVSNHASYLDGVVLVATLPCQVRFIAKAELGRQFVAGLFLRRLGAAFVERFDQRAGVADARSAGERLARQDNLLFFPEGTFTTMSGLRPFRSGAFVAAAEYARPVLPVVLRGTRRVLPGESRFPRHHPISVWIGAPMMPEGGDWAAAMQLKAAARAVMLRHLDEPDLAQTAVRAEIAGP